VKFPDIDNIKILICQSCLHLQGISLCYFTWSTDKTLRSYNTFSKLPYWGVENALRTQWYYYIGLRRINLAEILSLTPKRLLTLCGQWILSLRFIRICQINTVGADPSESSWTGQLDHSSHHIQSSAYFLQGPCRLPNLKLMFSPHLFNPWHPTSLQQPLLLLLSSIPMNFSALSEGSVIALYLHGSLEAGRRFQSVILWLRL